MTMNDGRIMLEDAEILYRNFTGIEGEYNPAGSRNFCIVLPEDLEKALREDGWNVRLTKDRGDGEPQRPYLPVQIGYKIRPPRIVMISWKPSAKGRVKMRTELPEPLLGLLDWVDIAKADVSINPRPWNIGGKNGIKAYCKALYITIADDYLEEKYSDIEEYVIDGADPMLQLTSAPHDDEDMLDLDSYEEPPARQIGR